MNTIGVTKLLIDFEVQAHVEMGDGINFNLLTPNVDYIVRTAPLTSKYCILCIYSTRPASWSSGQSLCLLIMRFRVRFPVLLWEFSLKVRIPAVTMVWVG